MAKLGEVREVLINDLKPYEKNAKIHNVNQIEKLKDSIQEFGFISPCLIDKDNNLIAGHGRVIAAKELGFETVPCIYVEGLTDTQRKAYILADNKLSELADWNMEIVFDELEDLTNMDFDIELTGFEIKPEYSMPIDEDDIGRVTGIGHTLKIDGTVIGMTDDEYDKIKDCLKQYTEENGTGFGFVGWLLND